ncbi:MAG TPA: hypothetical protein VD908_16970 [Cytophagales bacterium]|nr:hypothetical protein [Cytophagales bacterium]
MSKLSEQIKILERIDRLIRLKCTGTPKQLATKLEVSETTLYRILDTMRQLDAPIIYNISRQTYVYETQVTFKFGFYTKDISEGEAKDIQAGFFNSFSYLVQSIPFRNSKLYDA